MSNKTIKSEADQPAITAHHNRLAEEIIYRLLVQLPARSTFKRVWLKIDGPLPHPADGPLIGYLNHPSWWDGYATFFLHREIFRRRFIPYLMMEESQLRAYRFSRGLVSSPWIFVIGQRLHNPRTTLHDCYMNGATAVSGFSHRANSPPMNDGQSPSILVQPALPSSLVERPSGRLRYAMSFAMNNMPKCLSGPGHPTTPHQIALRRHLPLILPSDSRPQSTYYEMRWLRSNWTTTMFCCVADRASIKPLMWYEHSGYVWSVADKQQPCTNQNSYSYQTC